MMMHCNPSDIKVATAGILVKTGKKWKAQEAVKKGEAWLQHRISNVAVGQAVLCSFPKPWYNKASGREKR